MNFETLAFGVAGLACSVLLVLVGYTGDRMQKSIDHLREMLELKLTEVSNRLIIIDSEMRRNILDITRENTVLDRRVTRMEAKIERRGDNSNE